MGTVLHRADLPTGIRYRSDVHRLAAWNWTGILKLAYLSIVIRVRTSER